MVFTIGIVHLRPVLILIRRIFHIGTDRLGSAVKRRGIGRQDFKSRTGLPVCTCGAVQHEGSVLLPSPSCQRFYVPRLLIHHDQRGLRFRDQLQPLRHKLISGSQNGFPVGIRTGLRILLPGKQQAEPGVAAPVLLLPEIVPEHFHTVISDFAVRLPDSHCPVKHILRLFREIIRVSVLLIADSLYVPVLCRVNAQAAGVKELVSLHFRIPLLAHQVAHNLQSQFVHKPGIDGSFQGAGFLCRFDPLIYRVRQRGVHFLLCDITELKHFLQYALPSSRIFFGMTDRIIADGILCNPRDHGTFRQVELMDILIKISPCRRLDPVRARPHVHGIEIILKDQVLVLQLFLKTHRKVLLRQLALDLFAQGLLFRPSGKHVVFKELLRDRAGPLRAPEAMGNRSKQSPQYAPWINPVVLIEPLILNGHNGVLKILRDHPEGNGRPVGIRRRQLLQLVSPGVINVSGKSGRGNVNAVHIRSLLYDSPPYFECAAHENDTGCKKRQKAHANEDRSDMSLHSAARGAEFLFPLFNSFK